MHDVSCTWCVFLFAFFEHGLCVALFPADNHVPKPLVQALFKQLFSFVNVQLFNQLLLRRECCSFSNGEYVKTGLAQVCALFFSDYLLPCSNKHGRHASACHSSTTMTNMHLPSCTTLNGTICS
jgi:hypothetical protein